MKTRKVSLQLTSKAENIIHFLKCSWGSMQTKW